MRAHLIMQTYLMFLIVIFAIFFISLFAIFIFSVVAYLSARGLNILSKQSLVKVWIRVRLHFDTHCIVLKACQSFTWNKLSRKKQNLSNYSLDWVLSFLLASNWQAKVETTMLGWLGVACKGKSRVRRKRESTCESESANEPGNPVLLSRDKAFTRSYICPVFKDIFVNFNLTTPIAKEEVRKETKNELGVSLEGIFKGECWILRSNAMTTLLPLSCQQTD